MARRLRTVEEIKKAVNSELKEYRITFGLRYRREKHPTFEEATPDGWVTIVARNEQEAREEAHNKLGEAWAFIYPPGQMNVHEAQHLFPRGELARWQTTE